MTDRLSSSHSVVGAVQSCADIDCAEVRVQIRQRVLADMQDIIDAAIRKAKEGHFQVLKYLFEVAGLYPQGNDESAKEDLSLARALCDRLGLPPLPEQTAPVQTTEPSEEFGPRSDHDNGHALK